MKLNALSSFEEMLDCVDMLSVPASKSGLKEVYDHILSKVIPAAALPELRELNNGKSGTYILYGQWKDRRLKVQLCYDGENMKESTAYSLSKKMAIKAKAEHAIKIGFVTHHLDQPNIIQSAIAGWTAGHYDLG